MGEDKTITTEWTLEPADNTPGSMSKWIASKFGNNLSVGKKQELREAIDDAMSKWGDICAEASHEYD